MRLPYITWLEVGISKVGVLAVVHSGTQESRGRQGWPMATASLLSRECGVASLTGTSAWRFAFLLSRGRHMLCG